ncbi:MAG: hypothetical protein AAFX45_03005 [Pseudomonadota bacterium]
MKSEVELPYIAVEQFSLLLDALDAIQPFAARAGIKTSYIEAYDDWENIVDALFCSFIIQPIVDTQNTCGLEDFAKLGFHYRDGKRRLRFLFELKGDELFIDDIGLADDGSFKLLAFGCDDAANAIFAIGRAELRNASNVRVVSYSANAPDQPDGFKF